MLRWFLRLLRATNPPMRFSRKFLLGIALFGFGCGGSNTGTQTATNSQEQADMPVENPLPNNPLLAEWVGPYGGLPPFAKAKNEHFKPALEAAMAMQLEEIDIIANSNEPATFDNTIAALELAGKPLEQVFTVYGVFASTMNTPEFQEIERDMAPKLAAFSDKITQNKKLFDRVNTVYEGKEKLNPEQKRLTWDHYQGFTRAGAKLNEQAKQRMRELNQRLATLYTEFSQHVLADENDHMLLLEKKSDLAGLPPSFTTAAAEAAKAKGKDGKWAILNTRSSMEPFLTYSDKRDLRETVWRTYYNRGDNGDKNDNNDIIAEILTLRAERAKLLGYETHAHWRLENTMAKTPERAMELLEAVWKPATARVALEVKDMQRLANKSGKKHKIAPWDYRYYAEKVRKAKYDLDASEVKPYLQLAKLREGMFWVAGELLGLSFSKIDGVPVHHPDVTVYEVKNEKGDHVGLWYFDPYAREGKRSGAWMNAYRDQHRLNGNVTTIVSNNSNFQKGKPGEPVLISWTDAETLFHEFGHALHGLSSNVTYPSLSGTSVVRDYVEFPSQLLEHWLSTPEVLNRFALHYKTDKPIPKALIKKIEKAATFNQGFDTVEYLASALIDMKLHLAGGNRIDPDRFEKITLEAMNMPKEIVMRHRTPQFSHIFAGDGYSAGYYSYLWSDTLTADAFEAFTEGKGPYDKAVAKRLYDNVFSVGNTVPPEEGYKAFRGRDAKIDALMRKRGFPLSGKKR